MNKKHVIFAIAGRTSSGKSSIIKRVSHDLGLKQVHSYTTRLPRPTELIESDHIFINEDDIKQYQSQIVAYTEIGKAKYFCTRDQVFNADLYTLDPIGIKSLQSQQLEDLDIVVIYIVANLDVRTGRYIGRGNSIDEFIERNQKEDEQFSEFEEEKGYQIKINNSGEIEDAVKECEEFIEGYMEGMRWLQGTV